MKALDDTETIAENDTPPCVMCNGVGGFLGYMANLVWYRCRQCGAEFSENADNYAEGSADVR